MSETNLSLMDAPSGAPSDELELDSDSSDLPLAKPKRRWTIDVCRVCDRQAVWPFSCGHRTPDYVLEDGRPWCVPIVVRPVGRG